MVDEGRELEREILGRERDMVGEGRELEREKFDRERDSVVEDRAFGRAKLGLALTLRPGFERTTVDSLKLPTRLGC